MSKNTVRLRIFKNNTAAIVFDNEKSKVNTLGARTLSELEAILDDIHKNKKIKLLTIQSAKDGVFIAGADIKEIQTLTDEKDALEKVQRGQSVLNKIERLPFPTVAVINGVCLGGGAELALSCKYRITTDHPKTKIGFPEVQLGIFPGFGGTQRLPRIIGLIKALPMILTGKPIDGKKAYKMGLAHAYMPHAFLNDKLKEFTDKVLAKKVKKKRLSFSERIMQSIFVRYFVFMKSKKMVLKQTKGLYPAPLKALEVIKKTFRCKSLKRGLMTEAEEFSKLAVSKVCKNMIHVFYANELLKKEAKEKAAYADTPVKSAAVIGAGIMGGDIAWLFSMANIPVRLKDLEWKPITTAINHAKDIYKKLLIKRKIKPAEVDRKTNLISGTVENQPLKQMNFILEAVVEDMAIKQKVFKDLEKQTNNQAVLATNTSALSVTEIASGLKNPSRAIGFHFFNPANKMPLVEIIPTAKTSKETLGTAFDLAQKMRKTPIQTKDSAGFLVNRLLMPYMNEAAHMFNEGVDIQLIDRLMEKFGMPMGPFKLADAVGIDVGYKVAKELHSGFGDRMKPANILSKMVDQGLLGKKSGKGFYDYTKGGEPVSSAIDRLRPKPRTILDKDIVNRCILIMVNEAARCLEEQTVDSPTHLDMAMILGTGFPPFRGGLLKYADTKGLRNIMDALLFLSKQYDNRFDPVPMICDLASQEKTFYGGI